MGRLHEAEPDQTACEEFDEELVNFDHMTNDISPFMIARRGDCSFVQKVRNMENIGIAVAIVVDNRAEIIDQVLMSDDGTGGGIRIPSMLIGQRDGDILFDWFKSASKQERATLMLMSEFIMPEFDTVSLDFWFTSSSDRAINFLEDFEKIERNLGESLNFSPHYVFWECTSCDQQYLDNDCFGGGKYCAVEASNANIKGRDIVLEDLRQICMWEHLKESNDTHLWWRYQKHLHKNCYSVISEDCSKRSHEQIEISWDKTMQCVADSFGTSDQSKWGLESTSNKYIDQEIAYWRDYGTNIYPSIVIN